MLVEQRPDAVGLALAEAVHLEVGGGERAVAQVGPGRDLQRLEPLLGRPRGDLLQRAVGQAGGQESEFHAGTSTQAGLGERSRRRPR